MQKKILSYTPEEIIIERVEKNTIYKDDGLSDHIVAWHLNDLSEPEKEIIDQVIKSSNPTPVESCNNCLTHESDVFKHSYSSALENMRFIELEYAEISYNKINNQFISALQLFQEKIEKPNIIHIYDRKIVNNSYLEPPNGILDEYGYDKFNLMSNEEISVDVFIPQKYTAITTCHSHYSTSVTTITYQCYETSFSIPKLQTT